MLNAHAPVLPHCSFELGKTDVSFPEAAQTDDNDIALPANKDDSDVAELKQRVTELEAEMTKAKSSP